ncbi:Nodulin-like domain-containing protein [Balamuthia mandrillaris]
MGRRGIEEGGAATNAPIMGPMGGGGSSLLGWRRLKEAAATAGRSRPAVMVGTGTRRWLSLGAGAAMMCIAGTLYDFSVYGPELKKELGWEQVQLGFVGAMGNVGNYTGVLIGMFNDRWGGRAAALVSGLLLLFGYLCIYLAFRHMLPSFFVLVACFMFMVGQGSHGTYTAALMTNVKNFSSSHRGKIVGMLVSLYGLSGAIFTQLYRLIFASTANVPAFILLMAVASGLVDFISAIFLEEHPPEATTTTDKQEANETEMRLLRDDSSPDGTQSPRELLGAEDVGTIHYERQLGSEESKPELEQKEQDIQYDEGQPSSSIEITGLTLLKSSSFWFLFAGFFIATGSGLLFINHVGSHILSLGGSSDFKVTIVILLSLFNALGRVLVGFFSDFVRHYVPRIGFALFCICLMGAAHLLLAMAGQVWVVALATPFVGIAYGGLYAAYPTLVSLLFGLKNFGQNWGWLALAPASGGLCLGLLASFLYDMQVANQYDTNASHSSGDDEDHDCYGSHCYRYIYFLTGGLNLLAVIISLAVLKWTRLSKHFLHKPSAVYY